MDGTNSNGDDETNRQLGQYGVRIGSPADAAKALDFNVFLDQDINLSFYAMSPLLRVETFDAPCAVSAAITSDGPTRGYHLPREKVTATVAFNEPVTGRPQLPLRIGDTLRDAGYVTTGDDGTVFTFAHGLVAGDFDNDGIPIDLAALELDGATDRHADLDHVGLGTQEGHEVEGSLPPRDAGL